MNKFLIIIMATLALNAAQLQAAGDVFPGEYLKLKAFLNNTDPEKAYYNTDKHGTVITADNVMHLGTPASTEVKEVVKHWVYTNPGLANILLKTPDDAYQALTFMNPKTLLAHYNINNLSNSNYAFEVPSQDKKYIFKISSPANRGTNAIVMDGKLEELNTGAFHRNPSLLLAIPKRTTYQTISRKVYDIAFDAVAQRYNFSGKFTKPITYLVRVDATAAPYKGLAACDENIIAVQEILEQSSAENVYTTATPEQMEEEVLATLALGLWCYNTKGNVLKTADGTLHNVDMEQINRTNTNELFRASAFREIFNGANGIEELEGILNKAETAAQYKELQKCITIIMNSDTPFAKKFQEYFKNRDYIKRLNIPE